MRDIAAPLADIWPTEQVSLPPEKAVSCTTKRYLASALFLGQKQVVIEHQGQDYTLSITSNGKLILTK